MSTAMRTAVVLAAALSLVVAGCSGPGTPARSSERHGCITDFDPAVDYFPDKSNVLDAANFRIEYHNSYQVLTVEQPYPNGRPMSYVLVRCGAPDPALTGELAPELAGAPRVRVPVASLYSASTTQLGMLSELGAADTVTGVADPAYVVDAGIRRRIDAGQITGYAPGGHVNIETVLGAGPDVLVAGGTDDPAYPKLREAGVGVVGYAEWLEPTPLGRAEWVKVLAALTGTERRATEIFGTIRDTYRKVAEKASRATPSDALPGVMYQGSWSMPTGSGYAGRLILDAGGRYPWAGLTGPENRQLNFESVYAQAGRAPVWLVTNDWKSLAEVVAADSRYEELAAVRGGQVWSATARIGPAGGNDYWERGTARPDLVLADLVAILHPDLLPEHAFEFYRRVQP